jgi:adenylate kinase family enzyme
LKKVVIFGNSASGKSTLAKRLCSTEGLAHFDLDTVAWAPSSPPVRKALEDSWSEIEKFLASNAEWVIEGCYSDLIDLVLSDASEVIFMDLPIEVCISNAKKRPWEPHKYESKEAQDENLFMLIDWISQYTSRDDSFSRAAHQSLFERFLGNKTVYNCNGIHT